MGAAGNGGLLLSGKTAATRKLLPKKAAARQNCWQVIASGGQMLAGGNVFRQERYQTRAVFRRELFSGHPVRPEKQHWRGQSRAPPH